MNRIIHRKDLVAIPDHLPSGVYFLVFEREVIYVGQSVNVMARIATHRRKNRIIFDSAFYVPVAEQDLKRVEAEWIEELQPVCNEAGVVHDRDDDLTQEELEDLIEIELEHGEEYVEELLTAMHVRS